MLNPSWAFAASGLLYRERAGFGRIAVNRASSSAKTQNKSERIAHSPVCGVEGMHERDRGTSLAMVLSRKGPG
jgi:hypothetical protein